MSIEDCFNSGKYILMEGALSERLKREYRVSLLVPSPGVKLFITTPGWLNFSAFA